MYLQDYVCTDSSLDGFGIYLKFQGSCDKKVPVGAKKSSARGVGGYPPSRGKKVALYPIS